MNHLIFLIGFILGYFFWHMFAGKHEGDRPERSLRFLVGNYYIHMHHWFVSILIFVILVSFNLRSLIVFGLLTGSIFQGLGYADWYYIFYHKDNYEKIYKNFK